MTNKNIKQEIKGNKNIQIGVNKGEFINTNKLVKKIEVIHNSDIHITDSQAKQIQDKINELVKMLHSEGVSIQKLYAQEWTLFKNAFKITSYKLLPKDRFNEAIKLIQKRIAYFGRKKLRRSNSQEWRKALYKAIWAKSRNQLKMDTLQVYDFAEESLNLKKPISSLSELSDTRLNKLYRKIMTKK